MFSLSNNYWVGEAFLTIDVIKRNCFTVRGSFIEKIFIGNHFMFNHYQSYDRRNIMRRIKESSGIWRFKQMSLIPRVLQTWKKRLQIIKELVTKWDLAFGSFSFKVRTSNHMFYYSSLINPKKRRHLILIPMRKPKNNLYMNWQFLDQEKMSIAMRSK